jgi:shikimate dehydrogenase
METLDIVVQATSAGMKGVGEGENVAKRVPFHELPEEALAYDLVYNPPSTPFLETAYEESVEYCNGLGMLVGLAVETIKIWLGVEPDREVMLRAANKAICG